MKMMGSGSVFLAQLGMLVGLSWWGLLAYPGAMSWVAGIGIPVLVLILWQQFLTPNSPMPLPVGVKVAVQVALLLTGAAAFWAVGVVEFAAVQAILTIVGTGASLWGRGRSRDHADKPHRTSGQGD